MVACPVDDGVFSEDLEEAALDVKVKLAALVKYIAEQGKIFDITKFRVVDSKEKISKSKQERLRKSQRYKERLYL